MIREMKSGKVLQSLCPWLLTMKQGSRCVAEYALEFCTVVARSVWNEPTLRTVFRQGLNPNIVTELACCDEQLALDSLIDLTIRLDHLLQSRRTVRSKANVVVQGATAEPMQLGRAQLNEEEREKA